MALLIAHLTVLLGTSFLGARSLFRSWLEQVLAALLLAWANVVATSLTLAAFGKLGEPGWFFRSSLLLALGAWLALRRTAPEPAPLTGSGESPHAGLLLGVGGSLLLIAYAGIRLASTYEPNNYDSLTYHLPRAMYYLGQGHLGHFDTGNPRQIYFPFNYNLLQMAGLVYGTPAQTVNFLNLAAWGAAGLAIYRISRLSAIGANPALIGTWLALTATQVLAQGTATTNDLPTGAGILLAVLFALRWRATRQRRDALFAGIATGLAAGSKLTVVFFAPATGLIVLLLAWQHFRRGAVREYLRGIGAWILPGAIAAVLAAPFAVINLAEKGEWVNKHYDFTLNRPFSVGCVVQTAEAYLVQMFLEPLHRFTFDLQITAELNAWGTRTFFSNWNEAYAFSPLYLFPPDLNEDHVWFGFTGPLILLAALFCLWRSRRDQLPAAWLAWAGLGWFATYFVLNKWSLYNQRYFVPAILLLSPCLAAVIQVAWAQPRLRGLTRNLLVMLAICSVWFAGIYLLKNTSRPYAPLWAGEPPPPALPTLPPLMVQRLAGEPRINIDTTDGNERVFLFMNLGRNQRFTSFDRTTPDAYNLFSHWGFVRKVAYNNIEQLSSYTIVEVAGKKTAGVEFLATLGSGQPALDYYGLPPHPESKPATAENSKVMVTFYYGPREPNRFAKLRIKIAGLNAPDQARVKVGVDYSDGTSEALAAFTVTGDATASVVRPFRRFTVRVEDIATGRSLGSMDVPYLTRDDPTEVEAPHDPISLFADELVAVAPKNRLTISGLAPPEGPYPQWNLPLIRWAKAPVLRLEIPAQKHLAKLDFSFEFRLHTREAAQFDVLLNGEIVGTYEWQTSTGWFIKRLTLTPRPGVNIIEFRNIKLSQEPDWLGYLDRNPDVKAYVTQQGGALEDGARAHYETFGKKENRPLHLKRQVAPVAGDPLYFMFRQLRVDGYRTP